VSEQLKHLLSIDQLNASILKTIFTTADQFVENNQLIHQPLLENTVIANLFYEPSTRTRCSFELAAKYLNATVLNLDINTSAVSKGESVLDTLLNLQAMGVNMFVLRHQQEGLAAELSEKLGPNVAMINAGDGCHAHPSQALLDLYTIRKHKPDFTSLSVVIVGDVKHSRVARSQIAGLQMLGVKDIRLIAPKELLPNDFASESVRVYEDIAQGLENADVVITLRLQKERMFKANIPDNNMYFQTYGLTKERLKQAKPDAIVMHPGPINRGVEIASDVADGVQSVILQQVTFGVAVRMAIFAILSEG